ncbi:hypothetical protein LCGC14_2569940, partial [marine sediment metagenome]
NYQLDRNVRPFDADVLRSYYRERAAQLKWPEDIPKLDVTPDFSVNPKAALGFVMWATQATMYFHSRQETRAAMAEIISTVSPLEHQRRIPQ